MTAACTHPDTETVFRLGHPAARRCLVCGASLPLDPDAPEEVTGL